MNREDIIRMAREAGKDLPDNHGLTEFLNRFAALVAAAEREACAKLLDPKPRFPYVDGGKQFCKDLAAAIRARGQA